MLLVFSCTNCGKKFEKDESLAGKKARCKDCGHVFVIPTPSRRSELAPVGSPNQGVPASNSGRSTSLASRAPEPSYADPVEDPYGLNDVPPAVSEGEPEFATLVNADDEIALPRRFAPSPSQPIKKKSSRRDSSGGFFDGIPGIVYLIIAGALGLGFLLTLVSPTIGAYVFLGSGALSFLVLFLYGLAGVVILPFTDSVLSGFLCWICLPYLLGYVFREWDRMKGSFLSLLASFGVIVFMAVALPGLNAMRGDLPRMARSQQAVPASDFGAEPPAGLQQSAAGPFGAPRQPAPPGVQPPIMANSITVVVVGLSTREAGQAFGDQLTELVKRVSGGYQISGSGGRGRSSYAISMQNSVDVKTFADQITWAKVSRVFGRTIEVDASAH